MRSIPQKLAKTFDGPPTLERSGSEHQRAVTSLALLERARAWVWVRTLPRGRDRWGIHSTVGGYFLSFLRKERLGEKGGAFFNGKEGRVGFRKILL